MPHKKKNEGQTGFYSTFEEQLSHKHPLYVLANKIEWQIFEDAFGRLYSRQSRPADGVFTYAEAYPELK
jgi:IS5 family transposase